MQPNLIDEFVFIKFTVGPGYYRMYAYKIPFGNPKLENEENRHYFPESESTVLR